MEQWQEFLQSKVMETKTLTIDSEEKEFDRSKRSITHWISKKSVDRGRDIVLPEGIKTNNYKKNPIVLFNHHPFYPIAHNGWLKTKDDGKLAFTEFSTTPFADDIFQLNVEKVLNGWSIGFIPNKWDFDEKSKTTTFTDIELLEYSSVSLPMNQDAVTEGLKMVKSDVVKNILSEARENFEIKSIVNSLKDEIKSLKENYGALKEHSDSSILKDVEKLEVEMLEFKNQVNRILKSMEISGNDKAFKEILNLVRAGDISG